MEKERLQKIYSKTDGHCHICHGNLSYNSYGQYGVKGAWQVEHSKAKANGGSDHLNNLYPACIPCNISKGVKHTKTARRSHGHTRAPYDKAKKQKIATNNTVGGGIIGVLVGSFFGPPGAIIGASLGAAIGNESSPKK